MFICFFFKSRCRCEIEVQRFIGDLYYDKEGGGYQLNSEMSSLVMLTWENTGSIREEANVVTSRDGWDSLVFLICGVQKLAIQEEKRIFSVNQYMEMTGCLVLQC